MAAPPGASAARYSALDRLLHRIAFANPHIQRAVSEIENDLFAARLKTHASVMPVFVTGLPRAGTTLALEALYGPGEFAALTYRHMPFVLAPLFWTAVTKSFRKSAVAIKRAHGDGVEVSFDSPEAFEEVAWLAFLRKRYVREDRLLPLGPDDIGDEFPAFFRNLILKLAAPATPDAAPLRYLSKNNANIGRIGAIRKMISDARIVVCIREPRAHVRSMMTQHQRFMALHEEDRYAREYMEWIGHYDFGANLRPIDFTGRKASIDRHALTEEFWLEYWTDAYEFAEAAADEGVAFLAYERLFEDAPATFAALANFADVKQPARLTASAPHIRAPTTTPAQSRAPKDLQAKADALYGRLKDRSLGHFR